MKELLLPKNKAIEHAVALAKEYDMLSFGEHRLLSLLIASCPAVIGVDGAEYIRVADFHNFATNFTKAVAEKDFTYLLQKRGIRVKRVVDVIEFCESTDYLGQKGHMWKSTQNALGDFFSDPNYIEALATGGIGVGKSYFAEMSLSYLLYKLSCFHNPQLEYDLAPGSSIVFIVQSKNMTLAKKVLFDQMATRLRSSPYFQQYFKHDPNVKSELRFPKQILVMPLGGSDSSALGMNVFGGIIDELNFMARIEDSVHARYTDGEEYDQAERLYYTLIRRMKSRFLQSDGRLPGRIMLISSANHPDDFTSRKKKEALTDPTIFVSDLAQWEALPAERFKGHGSFFVEVGNETKRSRVLKEGEEAEDPEDILEVPDVYRRDFERDIEGALRDFAGVVTGTKNPFIPYRELIQKAQDTFVAHNDCQLFLRNEFHFSDLIDPDNPDWNMIVAETYLKECLLDRQAPFCLHIDVGISECAVGLAVGHITGYKLLPSSKYYSDRLKDFVEVRDVRAPIYLIDGLVRIVSKNQEEVDLSLIRDMVMYLKGEINLRWVTMDSYQSVMLIQAFRKAKIRSGVLSTVTSLAPYTELKLAIKDERIFFPLHERAAQEIREIQRDVKKDKIIHPEGGTKDLSDALAGVVYMLQRKEANFGSVSRTSRSKFSGKSLAPVDSSRVRRVRVGGGDSHKRHKVFSRLI